MSVPPEVQLQDRPCPLGCARDDETILVGRDLLHELPGEFSVVKCRCCGLMRTNPRPTPESISFYYPDDYGPYRGTQVQESRTALSGIKKQVRSTVRKFFNFNTTHLPVMVPGRLLEVGCASGAFLHEMAEEGWQVDGIEFSVKAAEAARSLGYNVHAGTLEAAPNPIEPYDLIVGWMVLEHLHDPVACLKKLRAWAKPGAWLVLSIPNAASLEFKVFKSRWYALQLPDHLYHFTPITAERILRAGGWRLEQTHHQRVLSNLVASVGYVLRDKGWGRAGQKLIDYPERAELLRYSLYPIAWVLAHFGQTGRMTIWARVAEQ